MTSRTLRLLASRPAFSAIAIVTLALGLGVNTAIFSVTREVLLRPLPYRDAERLVLVFETNPSLGLIGDNAQATAPKNYLGWRDAVDAFEQTAVFRRVSFNVSGAIRPIEVEGFRVSPSFFPLLGIEPMHGRGFAEAEAQPGNDAVVVLSNGFWRRQFSADPAIVGRTIDVDGTPCVVVGILPPSFKIFRVLNRELDVYRPIVLDPTDHEPSMIVWARLAPGITLASARERMQAAYAALPIPDRAWSADVASLATRFAAQSRPMLLVLQWAVALVLVIACANIANLFLALSAGRRKELAVRRALGATGWQIARDLAGESLAVAVLGGALGVLLAMWIVAVLNATVSFQHINRLQAFRVDGLVLAFTSALTLVAALIFGLLPVRAAAQTDVIETLKDSAHGVTAGVSNQRLRQALVAGELALSIVLTASALALTRSALALEGFGRGLTVDRVMTAQVSLNDPRYADPRQLVVTTRTLVDRLRASPGIAAASVVNYAPVSTIRVRVVVAIEGQPRPAADESWIARYWVATPDYFRTARIPMLAGRDFTAADDRDRPGVAIVSETFARRFWNTTDVIGRRLKPEFSQSTAFWVPRARNEWLTIVGVVGDIREDGIADSAGMPQLYLPYAQNPTIVLTVMARSNGPAGMAAAAIREAVSAADPQAPISNEKTFAEVIEDTFTRPRAMAWLIGAFATLALVLAAIGVYGVMSYLATVRTREIGIRIALGATPLDILSLIVRQAIALTAIGAAIGSVATPMALRLTSGLLFGVGPFDPPTLVTVTVLLTVVSVAASAIPAIRAARIASTSFR